MELSKGDKDYIGFEYFMELETWDYQIIILFCLEVLKK